MLNSILLEGTLAKQVQLDMFDEGDWFLFGDDNLKVGVSIEGKLLDALNKTALRKVRIVGKLIMKGCTPYIGVEHIEFKRI